MKILHVTDCLGGGVATYMLDIANELSLEHEVTVAYSETNETPSNIKRRFNANIKLIKLPRFRGDNSNKINWIRLVYGIAKGDYDVIHAHSSIAGFFIRIFTCLSGVDVYYTPHGYSFLRKDVGPFLKFIFVLLEVVPTFLKGRVVGCSSDEKEHADRISLRRAYCVTNGVNVKALSEVRGCSDADRSGPIIVGICGRVTHARNPDLFISIKNEVCKINKRIQFVWIGGGDPDKVNDLISNNIQVTGWIERDKALEYIKRLDVYLQPSLWEGMPIAVLEAQALGKPAAVSNIIGNNEIVISGSTGMVCNEEMDYVNFILKMSGGAELLREMSLNSIKNIHDNYNISVKALELSAIYEKH